jgi:hypothetical protein
MPKVALITFTVGDDTETYERLFLPSHRAYAEKWGFTFIQIKQHILKDVAELDPSQHTKNILTMQKLAIPLLPLVQEYDYCIFVDADIVINVDTAPNILDGIPYGKIAAVNERSYFGNADNVTTAWKRAFGHEPDFTFTVEKYYEKYKFGKSFKGQINSGLFVFQPSIHMPFFKDVFDKYAPRLMAGENLDGDQGPLTFEGHSRDLLYYLDERWNRIWGIIYTIFYPFLTNKDDSRIALSNIFSLSYAVHFAGRFGWNLLE